MNKWYQMVVNYKSEHGLSWPEMALKVGVNERSLRRKDVQPGQKIVAKLRQIFGDQAQTSELAIQTSILPLENHHRLVIDGKENIEVTKGMKTNPEQSNAKIEENKGGRGTTTDLDGKKSEKSLDSVSFFPENMTITDTINGTNDIQAERQELFIPIAGFVWLNPEELCVLDHPAVQRLGRINQLGQAFLVYRGATHKRLEHVIGSVHVAQLMIDAVLHSSEKARYQQRLRGLPLQKEEQHFIRLGALLHDVGHIVAGHTIEDEMCLVCKHDSDERLDKLLDDPDAIWVNSDGLSLGGLINHEYKKYLPSSLNDKGITPSEVLRLLIRKPPKEGDTDRFATQQKIVAESPDIRLGVCRDIIGNTICSDLLDYLYRDWYHVGKMRTFDDRILQYMEIRPKEPSFDKLNPLAKPTDQFIVNLGRRPKIRTDAVSQILELLEWRYQLSESVLFHRTKLAAEAMLDRALYEIWGTDATSVEGFLLKLGEDELYPACRKIAEEKGEKGLVAVRLLDALQKRELFTSLSTYSYFDLPRDAQRQILNHFAGDSRLSGVSPATNRNNVLQLLEKDFGLNPGSIAMFCPSGSMKAKVADVTVAFGDEVSRFSEYEKNNDEPLTAGHLGAQILRFERLWRIHFFIQRAEKKRIEPWIGELKEAIFKLALGQLQAHDDSGSNPIAMRIAKNLAAMEASPWYRYPVRKQPVTAEYQGERAATGMYPFGAHSIRSFIEDEPIKPRA